MGQGQATVIFLVILPYNILIPETHVAAVHFTLHLCPPPLDIRFRSNPQTTNIEKKNVI
jgi:hypothetical protein